MEVVKHYFDKYFDSVSKLMEMILNQKFPIKNEEMIYRDNDHDIVSRFRVVRAPFSSITAGVIAGVDSEPRHKPRHCVEAHGQYHGHGVQKREVIKFEFGH